MSGPESSRFARPGFTIEQVRSFWDGVIELYDRANKKIGYGHCQRFLRGLKFFTLPDDAKVLNVWARMGEAVPYLCERFPAGDFLHLEASGEMVAQARLRYPNERFEQSDLLHFDQPDEAFDGVLSLETLEHCPDPFGFVCELFRVLRPGGELVLSCPPALAEPMLRVYETFFENHGEGPHRFPWSRTVRRMIRQAGFELLCHRGTVFLPVIPDGLAWLDRALGETLGRVPGLREFGIRQFYYARKPEARHG
jgi:SAM-dependent methyltransferase